MRPVFKTCSLPLFFGIVLGTLVGETAFQLALYASDTRVTCDTTKTYLCMEDTRSSLYCGGYLCVTASIETGKCVESSIGFFKDCSQIQDTSICAGVCAAGPFAGVWCPLNRPTDACEFP